MRDRQKFQLRNLRCGPWAYTGWCLDEQDRLILMRVPPQVDLKSSKIEQYEQSEQPVQLQSPRAEDTSTSSTPSSESSTCRPALITSLPPELIHEIAWHLHPVDRVCLALTCKTLTSHTLSAPMLSPATWSRFSDHRHCVVPESYSLIPRLAHGWIPKDKLRYCSRCAKILPRKESYFLSRMSCTKNPRWNIKVRVERDTWDGMSKKARYAQLIDDWCYSSVEDCSILCCDSCRTTAMQNDDGRLRHPPVQCPECLERELTYVWRPPRKPWLRRKAWNFLRAVYEHCEFVVCFLGWCCFHGASFVSRGCKQCWRKCKTRWS